MFPDHWTEKQIFIAAFAEMIENQRIIMADISKLQASVANLQTDVTALINKPTVPTQAEIDAVQAGVDNLDAQVKTALAAQ